MVATTPRKTPPRILVDNVSPTVDGGRYPAKRTVGEPIVVEADLVRDGHEQLRAVLRHRAPGRRGWTESPMSQLSPDRWRGSTVGTELGIHQLVVEAWVDPFSSWRHEVTRKLSAGQTDLASELAEGEALIAASAPKLKGADRALAERALEELRERRDGADPAMVALGLDLEAAMGRTKERPESIRSAPIEIDVDPELARFGSWYELFPRSWGGLAGVEAQLPALAELGFDVIYLPPIHPIGIAHRKGRNNAAEAEPGDPGSPWAIGGPEGGHTAVHPDLGTLEDLERLTTSAKAHGLEIALDFAIQCSPDHPWLAEHPEWFHRRPDGTLKYAENPPKRYQDIYNVNFDSPDWRGLWDALLEVVLFWVERGVSVFRVDNPHTKPLAFWEWLIRTVRGEHPEVIFLAEAFTRPAAMYALAKVGFNQSYTYFTWKNGRHELTEYMEELAAPGGIREYFRPNFFANTPDILHEYLQTGGRAAFEVRLTLAATLGPSYGIYSGFENMEATPVRPGSEEYLDSEKYEVKERRLDGPLLPLVSRLNAIRRENRALRFIDVRFLPTHNDALIAYVKGEGPEAILTVVNLDPHTVHEGLVEVPGDIGLPGGFRVRDLITGAIYDWHQGGNFVRLEPSSLPMHVLRAEP
jgi:starch synthase (maltosyl-transferring)